MEESADEGGDAGSGAETDVPVSGTLSDGTYVPTMFTAEGGTGKVIITCPEVVLSGEDVQALIEFSSPHYEWVKVDGVQFDAENAGEADRRNSVFRIPAVLDEKLKISALTTAMSEPHEQRKRRKRLKDNLQTKKRQKEKRQKVKPRRKKPQKEKTKRKKSLSRLPSKAWYMWNPWKPHLRRHLIFTHTGFQTEAQRIPAA